MAVSAEIQRELEETTLEETEREPADGSREPEQLIGFLERDQLVADKAHPVPRARMSARMSAALWAMRLFVTVVGGMVIYTFFSQLGS